MHNRGGQGSGVYTTIFIEVLHIYFDFFTSGFVPRCTREGQDVAFSLSGNRNWLVKAGQVKK